MTDAARLTAAMADHYRIERELGAGGMATVYLARDLKHERDVAIKVLRADLAASLGPARFLREIQIAAQLQHPHILPLLDSGNTDGFLHYVMPFVSGQSLRERLARESELPIHEAVRLLVEIADALAYAHSHGVVHRDIKPDNIMLSGRHALVADFGVAKAVSEATGRNTITTLGVAVGTPTYMSPEQAAADPHIDHRSDIYSLGVMAYEMVSGRPPFTGATPQQILAAHVTEAPDAVSRRRPGVPPALDAIIMRCLAKRPADRFQSATELVAELEPLATPSVGITPTHTQPVPAVRVMHPAARWAIGAGVLTVLLVTGWVVSRPTKGGPVSASSLTGIQVTSTGEVSQVSLSPDGSRVAYSVQHCDANQRCLFDLVVQDVGGAGTLVVDTGATAIIASEWSPDGRSLLMFGDHGKDRGSFLIPATVQGTRRFLTNGAADFVGGSDTVAIVPSDTPGDTVAWIKMITVADGQVRDSVKVGHADPSGGVLVSPDGRWLFFSTSADERITIRIIDRHGVVADSFTETAMGATTFGKYGLIWISQLLTGRGTNDLLWQPIDMSTGRRHGPIDTLAYGGQLGTGAFDITRDGETFAFVKAAPVTSVVTLRRADLRSTQFTSRTLARSTSGLFGDLAPDGSTVLLSRMQFTGTAQSRIQLSLIPFDSGPETPVTAPLDTIDATDWSRMASSSVVYVVPAGKTSRLMEFDRATRQTRSLFSIPGHSTNMQVASLPDGSVMTARFGDTLVSLFTADGASHRTFRMPKGFNPFGIEIAPGGASAAIWGETVDSVKMIGISLGDGKVWQLMSVVGVNGRVTGWLTPTEMLVSIRETDETAALYSLSTDGRPAQRIGVLPRGAWYSSSLDGLRFVMLQDEPRADIWLIHGFGRMLRR